MANSTPTGTAAFKRIPLAVLVSCLTVMNASSLEVTMGSGAACSVEGLYGRTVMFKWLPKTASPSLLEYTRPSISIIYLSCDGRSALDAAEATVAVEEWIPKVESAARTTASQDREPSLSEMCKISVEAMAMSEMNVGGKNANQGFIAMLCSRVEPLHTSLAEARSETDDELVKEETKKMKKKRFRLFSGNSFRKL